MISLPRFHGVFFIVFFIKFTMTINPYISQICEQTGATEREVVTSMMPSLYVRTFPCVIHGRRFETHDDYINEMHEYLSGL